MPIKPLLCMALLLVVGCQRVKAPPMPVNPVPAGVVVPAGMPNDKWFQENVLASDVPVLIDFSAIWCGACQTMKPSIHEIEKAFGSRLKVVEIDVDEHEYLSDFFDVRGIPRLMVIKGGKIQADEVGVQSYAEIVMFLKPTLGMP